MKKHSERPFGRLLLLCGAVSALAVVLSLAAVRLGERAYEKRLFARLSGRLSEGEVSAVKSIAAGGGFSFLDLWPVLAALLLLLAFFLYLRRQLSGIAWEAESLGLRMEQMVAGTRTEMARWEDGLFSALSNQAELLYKRNCHLVELVQGEKEQLCQFTENMIHQMKTPLTALCLDLDLMEERLAFQEELPRDFRAQMEKKLADCQAQCSALRGKTEDFLAAGRLSAGKVTMAPAKADLDALTRQALEGLKPLLQKRGIRVEHDSSSQIPLYCDSGWMRAAISNVIKNSAEAMEPGGRLRIRHWDRDGWKFLEIRDEGGGFAPGEAEHLFERFYTGKSREGGSGLGLNIAKEVVEASHGTLLAQPVPEEDGMGEGARFLMRFRLLSGAEAYAG